MVGTFPTRTEALGPKKIVCVRPTWLPVGASDVGHDTDPGAEKKIAFQRSIPSIQVDSVIRGRFSARFVGVSEEYISPWVGICAWARTATRSVAHTMINDSFFAQTISPWLIWKFRLKPRMHSSAKALPAKLSAV